MFNYLFKNIPTKYVFAGYNVRKGLTIMTTDTLDGIIYDIFLNTYIDNYLSFYILMEDDKYKCVDLKQSFEEINLDDLPSRHLYRGRYYDSSEFGEYDKEQVIGVYGLRGLQELINQIDEQEKEVESKEISIKALLDEKAAYSGMEIIGAINRFNRNLKRNKNIITVPAIKKDTDDSYESLIGDEEAWNNFIADKTPDQILEELIKIDNSTDGIGNKKEDNLNDMLMRK